MLYMVCYQVQKEKGWSVVKESMLADFVEELFEQGAGSNDIFIYDFENQIEV